MAYYMNIHTGSVDTEEAWAAEGHPPATTPGLVEVIPVHTVTDEGIEGIHDWLGHASKLGRDHFDDAMLAAWAAEAERSLGDCGQASIELRSWDTVSGHTETYTVPDEHIRTDWVEAK